MAATKPMGTKPVSITVNLPPALYDKIARIALRRNYNLDVVIAELLETSLKLQQLEF